MVKFIDPDMPSLILRLWESHVYISLDHKPMWVGTICYDKLQRRLLFMRHKNYPLSDKIPEGLDLAYEENGWYVKVVSRRLDKVMLISNSYYADKYFYTE